MFNQINWQTRAKTAKAEVTKWKAYARHWEARSKGNNTTTTGLRETLIKIGEQLKRQIAAIDRQEAKNEESLTNPTATPTEKD